MKKRKWIKRRHKIVRNLVKFFFGPIAKWKYNVKIERFDLKHKQYLILCNHQTPYDQFFIGMAFDKPIYYVASEDIFSLGFISKLLKFLVAPIPIKKSTHDASAVINCIRIAKEGGSIAIFPEGNRTYSGKTEYINPAIAKLARTLKLPIAFARIEGGYGVQPRWSDVIRKGKMRFSVARVMEVAELEQLSLDELYQIILKELSVNENRAGETFEHKKRAEYLERAIYVCPYCGIAEFESRKDVIECKKCGRRVRYSQSKELSGIGFHFPYRYIGEWYDYQKEYMRFLELTPYRENAIFRDKEVTLFSVKLKEGKSCLKRKAAMFAYDNRFEIIKGEATITLCFDEVSNVSVLGKNKLNIYYEDNKKAYQIKGTKRFNALKYVNLYYHWKNIKEGNTNDEFLGL